MGVFKWLRRERVSISSRCTDAIDGNTPVSKAEKVDSPKNVGTIRTEEYKRDLAEFQARRSSGGAFETPINKPRKATRHSLPCTNCSADLTDTSFNYEKTSAQKYEKNKRRNSMDERLPNIQFLFSNQVFMPGNIFTRNAFTEVQRSKKNSRNSMRSRGSADFRITRQQIDFEQEDNDRNIRMTKEVLEEASGECDFEFNQRLDFDEEEDPLSPPLFFKNNSLPFEVSDFLNASRSDDSVSELDNVQYKDPDSKDEIGKKSSDKTEDDKLEEVMDELRSFDQWADEQLKINQSIYSNKSGDSKSNSTYCGLPLVASSAVGIIDTQATGTKDAWRYGHWGVVPVNVKEINVTLERVRMRECQEINILRKYRHPNIILLMGLSSDMHNKVHIICERFIASLHDVLHLKKVLLSAQTSVSYALDIGSALLFLQMQGYVHTNVNSTNIMVTHSDVAKLAELGCCVKYEVAKGEKKNYSREPVYVNLDDGSYTDNAQDCQPLLSSSSTSFQASKPYSIYEGSETYRWHPPELFQPDDAGLVYPCSRSDVYSLSLVLWECCNGALPWKSLSYEKLSELYLLWKTGIRLPQDGTYPGSLLELLQNGLKLEQAERMALDAMVERLEVFKTELSKMDDILIPERLSRKKSEFGSLTWEVNSFSDVDSRTSTLNKNTRAQIHRTASNGRSPQEMLKGETADFEIYSEPKQSNPQTPVYEIYSEPKRSEPERCYVSESEIDEPKGHKLSERGYSSNCSTPVAKKRVTLEIGTPGENLHKSDSTEYCSLFSPENRNFIDLSSENQNAKLSRTFTPKSYKSLHIKLPDVESLESLKSLKKDTNKKGEYNFDIKNYSLPTTPIARNNKLRKNAWLSGETKADNELRIVEDDDKIEPLTPNSVPTISIPEKVTDPESPITNGTDEGADAEYHNYTSLKRNHQEFSFDYPTLERCRSRSWSFSSNAERPVREADDALQKVNVKPLVEFHERWISEKKGKLLVDEGPVRQPGPPVKPASHCVDPLQTSMPQLNRKYKAFRTNVPVSPTSAHSGRSFQSEQYGIIRDRIGRSMSFSSRDPDRYENSLWKKERSKCISVRNVSTATSSSEKDLNSIIPPSSGTSLDEYIKDLIKKEFYQLLDQVTNDKEKDEQLIQKGTENVLDALRSDSESENVVENKSFSRVKINGNNKPLIQITFNRGGENRLEVLDSCVNVTICDSNNKVDKEDSKEDKNNSLKRCQAFSALQDARSTEDLYIDDDLSTHMEENFGGNMKLIPLHGSLHEILCDKADDCCLVKVKQENGCEKMYFVQNDGSTDAIDGKEPKYHTDKVIFKRSISLIEERIERIRPKDKKVDVKKTLPKAESNRLTQCKRPKSEIINTKVKRDPKIYSSSSPSIMCKSKEDIVNLENLTGYQDSSSDESVKSHDDFEEIEKKIEEDFINNSLNMCGVLEKISEENLSVNGEISEKENYASKMNEKLDLDMDYRKSRSCEELH